MSIRWMTAILTVLVQGVLLHSEVASAENLWCPGSIAVQESIKGFPEGWFTNTDEVPHRLMRVGFFDGEPKGKAELAPEKETRKSGKLYSVWRFDPKTAQDVWVSCSYSRTAMTLTQPLKKPYKRCTVVSDATVTVDGQPSVVSVECE